MREETVSANGINICCRLLGNPANPALVMIGGAGSQLIEWPEDFCDQLVARGHYLVLFDNRDSGLSSCFDDPAYDVGANLIAQMLGQPCTPVYTLSDMAADTVGLMDSLGIGQAHIFGGSLGGMVAQLLAIEYPERVLSLISMSSTTGDPDVGQISPEAIAQFMSDMGHGGSLEEVSAAAARHALLMHGSIYVDEDRARSLAERMWKRSYRPDGDKRKLLAVATAASRTKDLLKVDVPALVIHGGQDQIIATSGGERTAQSIPGARWMLIPELGHDLPPALVGQLVEAITSITKAS